MTAWWVGGCRNVVNLLELVPAEADRDDEISEVLHLVLETDLRVRAEQITIDVDDRRITLAGWVATEAERRQAEQDAWCMDAIGVSSIASRCAPEFNTVKASHQHRRKRKTRIDRQLRKAELHAPCIRRRRIPWDTRSGRTVALFTTACPESLRVRSC